MAQITYTNKVALNENPQVADINKVTDDDMNEIKSVVNTNYNNTIQITNTQPTDSDNKIWIDTGEIGSAASEITNEYSESIGLGYSANYVNNLHTYSTDEVRIGTWIDGKPLYRKLLTLGALKNNGETTVNYDSTYIIQKFDVYVENPTMNIKFKLPVPGTNYISAFDYKASNYIAVQTSSDRTAFTDNYAIIEYTKTTD